MELNNNKLFIYKDIYSLDLGVLELKLKDFEYKNDKLYIKNNYFNENKGFVIFYSPLCKHCLKIFNLYTDLALSNLNLFNFGAINGDDIDNENDYLCTYSKITKYPTLKYIKKDGTLEDYQFEYNEDNLIYFININI